MSPENTAAKDILAQNYTAELSDALTLVETAVVAGVLVWAAVVAVQGVKGWIGNKPKNENVVE